MTDALQKLIDSLRERNPQAAEVMETLLGGLQYFQGKAMDIGIEQGIAYDIIKQAKAIAAGDV